MYEAVSYMAMSAFTGTLSITYKHLTYTNFDQLFSRNHPRSCWKDQILSPPGWLTHWNKRICVAIAGDTWREYSGQSKMPSQNAPASFTQMLNCEGGYDFKYTITSPSTVLNQSINLPVQMTRQGVPGSPKELITDAWVYRQALLWYPITRQLQL